MVQDFTIQKLALIHGNVITMDEKYPRAQAILVIQDKIAKVSSDAEITRLIDEDTKEIDLQGRTIVPGFIDCHVHFPQLDIIGSFGEQLLDWLPLP